MQMIREVIRQHTGIEPPELPPAPVIKSYGEVEMEQSALLLDQLEELFPGDGISAHKPDIMEEYGQS